MKFNSTSNMMNKPNINPNYALNNDKENNTSHNDEDYLSEDHLDLNKYNYLYQDNELDDEQDIDE